MCRTEHLFEIVVGSRADLAQEMAGGFVLGTDESVRRHWMAVDGSGWQWMIVDGFALGENRRTGKWMIT